MSESLRVTRRGIVAIVILIVVVMSFVGYIEQYGNKTIHHSDCYVKQQCGEDDNGKPITFSN